jgi:fumarylacetoacetate (FAA) hydrolase family protein
VNPIVTRTLSDLRNKGGRPKGTTKKAMQDEKDSLAKAITAASKAYLYALINKTTLRLPRGTINACIAKAKKDHNIPDGVKISNGTVLSRVHRRNEKGLQRQSLMPCVI